MLITRQILSTSEEMTVQIGKAIGCILQAGDVVLINGKLGAGKTRVAKGIVSSVTGLDPDEVVSPTFTLVNTYDGDLTVHHVDLYRIDAQQADGLGLDDALADGVLVVEWGEKMAGFTEDPLWVRLSEEGVTRRKIAFQYDGPGLWPSRIDSAIKTIEGKRSRRDQGMNHDYTKGTETR